MDLSERPDHVGARHPWEKSRFRFFRDVLEHAHWSSSALRVLDAGAGDAWFSTQLLESMPDITRITCWDAEYSDALIADLRATTPDRIEFRRERPDTQFDLVLLLDVLEHVPDDRSFLKTIVETNLATDGFVLISVPAWQILFSSHDTRLRHYRRYSPEECRRVIDDTGLQIVRQGGLFHSLLAPRTAQVVKEKLLGANHDGSPPKLDWNAGALVTRIIDTALHADNYVSHRLADIGINVPGMSYWALCKRT
ncbi:MAG TPA: methyltransferase domain-containing protein [Polyangium sp.]|nr:methyltransferase domain-containing protein [Polyangium sp.]